MSDGRSLLSYFHKQSPDVSKPKKKEVKKKTDAYTSGAPNK